MPAVIDMTGARIGKLTVLYPVERPKEKNRRGQYWLCQCDCGNTVVYIGKVLRRNEVVSCGYCSNHRFKDETGNRYGRLLVIGLADCHKNKQLWWKCKCDCGSEVVVKGASLRNGATKSCGCISREAFSLEGKKKRTHGYSRTPIYTVWTSMKARCYNENNWAYPYYGGRGIKVCDEWLGKDGAKNFCSWAFENGYEGSSNHRHCTLDRIDNDGDYCPENCRWVCAVEQANNKRNNRFIEFNGAMHTFTQWSKITGLPTTTIRSRIYQGWPTEKALTVPKKQIRRNVYESHQ